MPTLTIDSRPVTVPAGATVLDAAERLGIDIPTLCFLQGYEPSTSCLVCMVKHRQTGQLVPACATAAADGMEIESETAELFQVRRTALELLLSDHVGDCLAPCLFACPAHMDIPLMLRQIGNDDVGAAIATIKKDIALPAVLGRVCSKPCEQGCRRGAADGPVAVCELKRFVADKDLASDRPYLPVCRPPTGKRVAIVGAGPTGLAAAYELQQAGHACTIYDDRPEPGGRLRYETSPEQLPRDVLDAEIQQIVRLGVRIESNCSVGAGRSPKGLEAAAATPAAPASHAARLPARETLEGLADAFDAVLVACGTVDSRRVEDWGLKATRRGIDIDRRTFETSRPGLFAAGNAIRGSGLPVRSVADGKEAAQAVARFLAGQTAGGHGRPFSSRIGRVPAENMSALLVGAGATARNVPEHGDGYTQAAASDQAGRCLACGCPAHNQCKLEHYARRYGANPGRFAGARRQHEVIGRGASVLFEPGKCINCELCVQIAAAAKEPLGLTFVGRGFDIRLAVPFGRGLDEALVKVALECVAACPTAALSLAHRHAPPATVPLDLSAPARQRGT